MKKRILIIFGVGVILGLVVLLAFRLITGRSLGLKSFVSNQIQSITSQWRALADRTRVKSYNKSEFTNVLFIHHSVGNALIEQGNVRRLMTDAGLSFWDHDYNYYGITDPNGIPTGYSFNIPNDNTDPDGYAHIFSQPIYGAPLNTLSGIMQYEVIIFKSCFPASDINSDQKLAAYQEYYLLIRDFSDQHPEKLFIAVTIPPLNPSSTTPEIAARARIFTKWLASEEYLSGHPNLTTFDLYSLLAEPDPTAPDGNMLRQDYRTGGDSHPNLEANKKIGPIFVEFVIAAIEKYRNQYVP